MNGRGRGVREENAEGVREKEYLMRLRVRRGLGKKYKQCYVKHAPVQSWRTPFLDDKTRYCNACIFESGVAQSMVVAAWLNVGWCVS
jgi:hypothetical protein